MQLDGRDLPQHDSLLRELPTGLVIDHNGKFIEPVTPSHPGFRFCFVSSTPTAAG